MLDRLLCKKDVFRILGISRSTLDRRRGLEKFPKPTKPGGTSASRCYWRESDVQKYLDALTTEK